jgi:hypothetical protein
MHLVHYRVAYDPASRRATDRLTGVPVIGRMLQTWEATPSATGTGTSFSFFYAVRSDTEIDDPELEQMIIDTIREHARGDVDGLKAFCEDAHANGGLPVDRTPT